MAPASTNNCAGFTVIEFLVAVVILMVGLLGLLQAVNVSMNHNMNNQFRNDAVIIADERMELEKTKPFDLISTTTRAFTTKRDVRNAFKNYSVVMTGTSATTNTKSIQIVVSWKSKNNRLTHTISSLVTKSQF